MARDTWPAMLMIVWRPARASASLVFSLHCPGPFRAVAVPPTSPAHQDRKLAAGRWPQQDTVLLLSCLEAQKLRFQRRGPLRCAPWSFPPAVRKFAGPVSAPMARLLPIMRLGNRPRRNCPRVGFGAETCKVGSRKRNERFNLNRVPLLRVPAPTSLIQFDCVTLRSEGQPHPFTIGGQQDRLNSHSTLVSNRHQHRSLISWLLERTTRWSVAQIRCSLWLGICRRGCPDAGRETTGSDKSRPGMAVPFALAAATGISSVTGAFSACT